MRVALTLFLLLFWVLSSESIATTESISFLTHSIKPFAYEENGKIDGFAVEIVKEMMKSIGHPEEFTMIPFARGLQEVQINGNYAFFIVARRPERESTVKWVGPLVSSGVYFYKMAGLPLEVNNLNDLKKVRFIGVGRGNADHVFLRSLGFTNLQPVNNQLQSVIMLEKGRVDVTPVSELVMPAMAKYAGIDMRDIEKIHLKLYDSVLYLVFSLNTPDETVAQWQKALDSMKASGKYEEIYKKYIMPYQ